MLPALLAPYVMPHLDAAAMWLFRRGVKANVLTLLSFLAAVAVMAAAGLHAYWVAVLFLILNRICDGLDGIVARLQAAHEGGRLSPFGTFADTLTDIFLYGGLVFVFVLGAPAYALPGAFLLFAWLLSAFASLAFDIEAESKGVDDDVRQRNALFFFDGVASQFEMTIVLFLMCLLPSFFPAIAILYGIVCLLTVGSRVLMAYKYLR